MTQHHAVHADRLTYSYRTSPPRRRRPHAARSSPPSPPEPGPQPPALDAVTLTVEPGEAFGLVGPNGCGKTTLLRALTGLIEPDSGTIAVFGDDATRHRNAARLHMGVVFQNPSLDAKLTVRENLLHHGRLYALSGRSLADRINRRLADFQLADHRDQPVETLSGGMRRRVELAKALLHEPRLLVLDEPSTGLDPIARRDLWDRLSALRKDRGVTILVTTHLPDEADRCDRLAFLNRGRLLAVDTPAGMKSRIGGDVITITPAGTDPDALRRALADRFEPWPDAAAPALVDDQIRIETADGPAMVPRISEAFAPDIAAITVGRPSLEDVFVHMTGTRFAQDQPTP